MGKEKLTESVKSHFLNLFTIALADSETDSTELDLLYEIGKKYGVEKEEMDGVIQNPHKIRFFEPKGFREKIEQLYDLVQMILADDKIDPREITVCKNVAIRMGFLEENVDDIIDYMVEAVREGRSIEAIIEEIKQ